MRRQRKDLANTELAAIAPDNPKPQSANVLPTSRVRLNACESALLLHVNAERVRNGLSELKIDRQLQELARQHCRWMAVTGKFKHRRGPVIENIGEGHLSVASVMKSWMASEDHRRNILDPAAKTIGATGYLGKNGKAYWVQEFRRK